MSNKELYVYRAPAVGEKELRCCKSPIADPLSMACSRVIASSRLGSDFYHCFSEDPREAYRYSLKTGYSGEIACVKLVESDEKGVYKIDGCAGYSYAHRVWMIEDYIHLFSSENTQKIMNINRNVPMVSTNVLSFARNTPRAYAQANKTWLLHTDEPYKFTYILTDQQKKEIAEIKRFLQPSYNNIEYGRKNILAINFFLNEYEYMEDEIKQKKWYQNTVLELTKLKCKYEIEVS